MSEPIKITKEQLEKEISEMVLVGDIDSPDNIINKPEPFEKLKKKFPTLTTIDEYKKILQGEINKIEVTDLPPSEETADSDEIKLTTSLPKLDNPIKSLILYDPQIVVFNPDEKERTKMTEHIGQKIIDKNTMIDFIDGTIWEKKVIPFLEQMMTTDHVTMIKHSKGKPTPYVTALIAKDIISTCMNIRLILKTTVYEVPVIGDVKVSCSCTVIDGNRNVYVDGVIAEEYLLKRRGIDKDSNSEILIYGDGSRTEVAQTRAVRRAIEYILPPFVMDKVEKMALKLVAESQKLPKKK